MSRVARSQAVGGSGSGQAQPMPCSTSGSRTGSDPDGGAEKVMSWLQETTRRPSSGRWAESGSQRLVWKTVL